MPPTRKKAHRRSRPSRKGGALIGHGAYGCGFLPSLRCRHSDERMPWMFSKLLHKANADDEYARTRRIKELDWEERYFLLPLWEPCEITVRYPSQRQEMDQCDAYWQSRGKPPANFVLQYRNGGATLERTVLTDPADWAPLFQGLANLLRGVALLHDNDLAHLDIKADNVVLQRETRTDLRTALAEPRPTLPAFTVRLIDFGLSLDLNTLTYPTGNVRQYGGNLIYRPFDLRYIAIPPDSATVAQHVQKFNAVLAHRNEYMFELPAEYFPVLTEEFVRTVLFAKPFPAVCPTLAKAADVYSLGILLGIQYGRQVGHTVHQGRPNCLMNTGVGDRLRKVPFGPQLKMPAAMYAWHTAVFQEITLPLFSLIGRMLNPDPDARPTIAEVCADYEALPFARHFTAVTVAAFLIPSFHLPAPPLVPPPVRSPENPRPPAAADSRSPILSTAGGAVVGTYGCGIVPSLKGSDQNVRNATKFSKRMRASLN